MSKTRIHRVLAVLKLAKTVHDLSAQGRTIIASVIASTWFPTPNPSTATITADIDALDAAETVALTKVKGAAGARDVKLHVVRDDLHHLLAYVQGVADANPTQAEAIIKSAGMTVKKPPARAKQDFVAHQGLVSGSAKLTAKSAGRASYEWEVSTDQKTWTALPSSLQAHTVVPNLPPGTTQYFRHRAVTKAGPGDWSQVVSLIVK